MKVFPVALIAATSMIVACTIENDSADGSAVSTAHSPAVVIGALQQEPMFQYVPQGLGDPTVVELPATALDPETWISRSFVAPNDDVLLKSCEEYVEAAGSDGWVGNALADENHSGIVWTVLTKDNKELDISCVTTDSFDQLANDRDEIRLTVRIRLLD